MNPETYPSWAHIIWDYPEREGMPAVKFHWYEGRKDGKLVQPDRELFKGVHFADAKDKNNKDKDTRETFDEEGLLRLLRLARMGCTEIFREQLKAVGK